MDLTEADVIKRVLGEHRLDADRALAGLIRTLIDRHVRCKRDPRIGTGGMGLRPTVLEELIVIIGFARDANLKAYRSFAADGKESDPAVNDEQFMDGLLGGNLAAVQQALIELLHDCQRLGERDAELNEDDDEDPPMRLVRD